MVKQIMRLPTAWSSVYSQTRVSVMTCAKTLVSGMTFSSPESLHSSTDKNVPPYPHCRGAQKALTTLICSHYRCHLYINGSFSTGIPHFGRCLQSLTLNILAPCVCYHPAKCVTVLSLQRPISYGSKSLQCQCTSGVIKNMNLTLPLTQCRTHTGCYSVL